MVNKRIITSRHLMLLPVLSAALLMRTTAVRGLLFATTPFSSSIVSRRQQLLFMSTIIMNAKPPSSSSSSSSSPSRMDMDHAVSLLESVYGPVDDPSFPRPMPVGEAGTCHTSDGKEQRRYLWTDAFGVLAYVSLAEHYAYAKQQQSDNNNANNDETEKKYRHAANKLIDVVHDCLGKPVSTRKYPMKEDDKSPTGYVGLRIGKVESSKVTDYGMRYDGMYWHYMDKWLLALGRAGRAKEAIQISKSCFPYFYDSEVGTGIRWKLSVDATAPPSLRHAYPSDDTLMALIVFTLLEQQQRGEEEEDMLPSLSTEIELLQTALEGYRPRVTDDPLGWGLEAIFDQFIEGQPRTRALASLQSSALHERHLELPFRLYGAMMGARIVGDRIGVPTETVNRLIELSLKHEARVEGSEEHSSINRVMLAMCLLCPGALGRRHDDPIIRLS